MVYDFQPTLFSVAYNMLCDRAEAEDVVEDVFLKWHQTDQSHVENVKSYLVKPTVNSALNYLQSAHKKRLTYPNIWLPEPSQTPFSPSILPINAQSLRMR